jgi:hypothetical protein
VCNEALTACTQPAGPGPMKCTSCGSTTCCPDNSCSGGGCCDRGSCIAQDDTCLDNVGGGICSNNACGACGALGDPCCVNAQGNNPICTAGGLACGPSANGNTCQPCGVENGPCCSTSGPAVTNRTCSATNLVCQANGGGPGTTYTCRACGAIRGQPCCAAQTCTPPLNCNGYGAGATCQ